MASNNPGLEQPPRPRDASRSRGVGAYTQPSSSKAGRREADIAHLSGQMEATRKPSSIPLPRATGLPRPGRRDPSPAAVPRTIPPAQPAVVSPPSRFGFGRSARKNASSDGEGSTPVGQELRTKSSRNVLRRKPSTIAVYAGGARPTVSDSTLSLLGSSQAQKPAEYVSSVVSAKSIEAYHEVFGGRSTPSGASPVPRVYPELDRYGTRPEATAIANTRHIPELPHKLSTQDLPPPTPLFPGGLSSSSTMSGGHNRYSSGYSASGYSASPSTRFSESPGPGGVYSRDTTPTSISSQSPGIIALAKPTTPRLRQGSPAQNRPPITRRRTGSLSNDPETSGPVMDPQGLPSLRESLTSSSSNSTVKGADKGEKDARAAKKKKQRRLSPLPPSPPPRKSSQKFKKSPESEKSTTKSPPVLTRPIVTSPLDESPTRQRPVIPHAQLKGTPPLRPSREGAPDLQGQLGEPTAVIQSNLTGIGTLQERRRSLLPKSAVSSPPPLTSPSTGIPRPNNHRASLLELHHHLLRNSPQDLV